MKHQFKTITEKIPRTFFFNDFKMLYYWKKIKTLLKMVKNLRLFKASQCSIKPI